MNSKDKKWVEIYNRFDGRYDDLVTEYQKLLQLLKRKDCISKSKVLDLLAREKCSSEYADSSDVCRGIEIAKGIVENIDVLDVVD